LKESDLLMLKIVGIGMIFGGVMLYLIRHFIPGGVEVAVFYAIFWSIFGIVVFLAGMGSIEISKDESISRGLRVVKLFNPSPTLSSALPKLRIKGDNLFIETEFIYKATSLFSYCRVIHVNKSSQIIEIKVKKWWQWKRVDRIPFSNIEYIDIIYPKPSETSVSPLYYSHSLRLYYYVFLITKTPFRRVDLFSLDCRAEQDQDQIYSKLAHDGAELIAKYTGTRIGVHKPVGFPLAECDYKYFCRGCGHKLSPNIDSCLCPYCGGKDIRIE